MTDSITTNVVIGMPSQLFTLAREFKAVANGAIYIGLVDTDPTIPTNQIQVYIEGENGTPVPVSQPISINSGGYPVYNGQIYKFLTTKNHSMSVYNSMGVLQFYFPDLLKYDPDQLEQRLSSSEVPGTSLVVHSDGKTVEQKLNETDTSISSLDDKVSELSDTVDRIEPDYRKIIFNHEDNAALPYGAFCDGVSLGRYEYLVHRESKTHYDDGGGVSLLRLIRYDTRTETHEVLQTFGPVSNYDFRDPSINWFPQSRRFVISCAMYNVPAAIHDRSVNYYVDNMGIVVSTTYNTVNNYFQWGKALYTPQSQTMIFAYSTSGDGTIGVFVGNGLSGSENGFNKVADIFTGDSTLLRNECSAIVWDGKLVVCARTQTNGSGNPLQNMSVIYTNDLSGETGWSGVQRIGIVGVAPRMFIAPNGDLVATAGVSYQGSRGSIAAISTENMNVWRTSQIVYSASGFGGYSSAYLRDDGLVGIYTFNEIVPGNAATNEPCDTWLAYVPVTTFLYGYQAPKKQINMYGGLPAYGMKPIYTAFTGSSENVYIYIPNQITFSGFGFWCNGQTAVSTSLYLESADGTNISTITGIPNVTTPTLITAVRSSGPITLSAGIYRIRLDTGRIGYINNQHLYYLDKRGLSHVTVGIGELKTFISRDCAIGLLL